MIQSMQAGSVIVDMAAAMGGNCEGTQAGETITINGVTIIGETNIPSLIPVHASDTFSKNIEHFLDEILTEGNINLDEENEIISGSCITKNGKIIHPQIQDMQK